MAAKRNVNAEKWAKLSADMKNKQTKRNNDAAKDIGSNIVKTKKWLYNY